MEIDEVGEATVGDLRPAMGLPWCFCVCVGVCVFFFFFFFFFFFLIFFKVWGHYNLRGLVQFPLIFG
jgi:hypothetical protein